MEKYYFLYELCWAFQNLNLNGLFMFLMYIPSACYPHLIFLLLKSMIYQALRIAKTNHAIPNVAMCILK